MTNIKRRASVKQEVIANSGWDGMGRGGMGWDWETKVGL